MLEGNVSLSCCLMTISLAMTGWCHGCCQQVTYEQQQELLKQELQAAAADAAMVQELELARQDTWTVFVLVELLGSHLITPSWSYPVQLGPGHTTGSVPTAVPGAGSTGSTAASLPMYCSWNAGYVYQPEEEACASMLSQANNRQSNHPAGAAGVGGAAAGSVVCGRSGVPVDLMSCCITYPQFVEVLLCLMAARATALLEPDVKQLRPLTLDEEMEVRQQL